MLATICREIKVEQPPDSKTARLDPFADLRDHASSSSSNPLPRGTMSGREELARYKALQVPAASNGILNFWKEHAQEYPVMSHVARRLYSISASTAQSERDFSSVGHTVTDMRSRLSASKVEAIEMVRWGMRAGLLDGRYIVEGGK